MRNHRLLFGGIAAIAATTLVALTGCSADNDTAKDPAAPAETKTEVVDEIRELLPKRIQDAGVIKVGTEAYYPPYDYFGDDEETIVGLDPDLLHALGGILGVEFAIENMAFDGLLPALEAGRFDMVSGALGTTEERIAKYDFVTYFSATQGITTVAENPKGIKGKDNLCGLNVAVLDASYQLSLLESFNDNECASNPMKIQAFQSDSDALMQLQNGRADAHIAQYPVAVYNATTFGDGKKFAVVNDETFGAQLLGKIFRKDEQELRDAVQAAMNELIRSGAYGDILEEHGLALGAVETSEINVVAE
ncbi:ABC transporter substrate-binding protein [Leucobacter chinensis]|uniref:ABC transporter substrate-binding protein n=1 Tax=Leucobacter chinensis TaxID=2851010 RepID=UPI001C241EE5